VGVQPGDGTFESMQSGSLDAKEKPLKESNDICHHTLAALSW
jgi:hypothetical protein